MTDADFKYLMENILTDGQFLLANTVLPSKFDGLNVDGLAGKRQNCQNFPPSKFPAIRYKTYGYPLKNSMSKGLPNHIPA